MSCSGSRWEDEDGEEIVPAGCGAGAGTRNGGNLPRLRAGKRGNGQYHRGKQRPGGAGGFGVYQGYGGNPSLFQGAGECGLGPFPWG
ncbi:hypothetical protein D3C76_1705500 [compost metagenome]